MGDARILSRLLSPEQLGFELSPTQEAGIEQALAAKDAAALAALSQNLPAHIRLALCALPHLYGDASVLTQAAELLGAVPGIQTVLDELAALAAELQGMPGVAVSFDLADVRGYAYYSGARFALFVPGASDAVVRGGRYDEVGAVFGRKRPAVGFSLDLRELVGLVPAPVLKAAIRAPWGKEAGLRQAIAALRAQGETVVCVMPGHESEVDEFHCDRELRRSPDSALGAWVLAQI